MGIEIKVQNVKKDVNKLSLVLDVNSRRTLHDNKPISDELTIDSDRGGSVLFQVMVVNVPQYSSDEYEDYEIERHHFIRLTTKKSNDERFYIINYTQECQKNTRCLTTDDGTWRLIDDWLDHSKTQSKASALISLEIIGVLKQALSCDPKFCEPLRDDTEFTDFELRGMDGSVLLHRAVAAACSPVFKRMFGGTWRETKEGAVDVKDTSKDTLQHLKDYMYLSQVPDTGLEQLLLLASFYMMPDLRLRCVNKLKTTVTEDTVCDLITFAVNHHLSDLLVGILCQVKNGKVKVENIEVASL